MGPNVGACKQVYTYVSSSCTVWDPRSQVPIPEGPEYQYNADSGFLHRRSLRVWTKSSLFKYLDPL